MKNFSHIKKWYAKQPQAEKDKIPALIAGAGVGLVAAQSLVVIGRPVAGYVLIALGLLIAVLMKKPVTLGPKWMWIPLVIIFGTVVLRTFLYDVAIGTAELGFMSLMFAGYFAGRICGKDIFYMLPPIVIILSILVYLSALNNPGAATGGMLDTLNYNLTVAVLIIGTLLCSWHRKWIIVLFTLPAIFLTGASEGILVLATIVILAVIRRDWSHRLLLPAGALSIVFLATFYTGAADSLYTRAGGIIDEAIDSPAVSKRIDGYKYALTDIRFLGHGYDPTYTNGDSIHNVPLRVLYELGPIAALAWCFAMLVGLIKTRWRYIFAVILVFSLVDHLMWTWLAPIPFVIAGVTTVDNEGDFLFRKEA